VALAAAGRVRRLHPPLAPVLRARVPRAPFPGPARRAWEPPAQSRADRTSVSPLRGRLQVGPRRRRSLGPAAGSPLAPGPHRRPVLVRGRTCRHLPRPVREPANPSGPRVPVLSPRRACPISVLDRFPGTCQVRRLARGAEIVRVCPLARGAEIVRVCPLARVPESARVWRTVPEWESVRVCQTVLGRLTFVPFQETVRTSVAAPASALNRAVSAARRLATWVTSWGWTDRFGPAEAPP
jgi:hypothetical protein